MLLVLKIAGLIILGSVLGSLLILWLIKRAIEAALARDVNL